MATRAECEANALRQSWTCAGPLALSQERRDVAVKAYDNAVALIDAHDLAGGTAALRVLASVLNDYLTKGLRESGLSADELAKLDDPAVGYEPLALLCVKLIRWHWGCGESKTEVIRALPFDGQDHKVPCPKCGTTSTVRRPLPDEDRAEVEKLAGAALDEALG